MAKNLKERLFKTRQSIFGRIKNVFTGKDLSGEMRGEIEEILITSDVSISTAQNLLNETFEGLKGKDKQTFIDSVKLKMVELLSNSKEKHCNGQKPLTIMMAGVNGTGKTTTIGKLAKQFKRQGKTGILGACDTFRAAAVEQLEIWGERTGCRVIKQKIQADPASVAYDSLKASKAQEVDFLMLDTAGRLHTKFNLMEELKKIKRVLKKEGEVYPQEIWLVLDATFGQNSLAQVKEFNEVLGLTGIVITKMDGTAKGGILLTIANDFSIPIRYIGIGEGEDDLMPFDAKDFVEAIFS